MVLPNYPCIGLARRGALTDVIPMSWVYDGIHRDSNTLRQVSGEPIPEPLRGDEL